MGLPTTWFFLCLVHLFWIDHACANQPTYKSRAAVCGDDLVAYWPREVIGRYHDILNQCGGKISAGKHFVFPSAGVFTEKCFKVKYRSTTVTKPRAVRLNLADGETTVRVAKGIKWFGTPSLKGLVAPSGNRPLPRWLTLGSIVESLVSGHCPRSTVMRGVDVLYPKWNEFYRKYAIPALPQCLGGSGLYRGDPKLRRFPTSIRLSAKIAAFGRSSRNHKDVFLSKWASAPTNKAIEALVRKGTKEALTEVSLCRSSKSCLNQGKICLGTLESFQSDQRSKWEF